MSDRDYAKISGFTASKTLVVQLDSHSRDPFYCELYAAYLLDKRLKDKIKLISGEHRYYHEKQC